MDSAALQAHFGGRLGGSMEKTGHTTIPKTERVELRRVMFTVFVGTAVLFIHSNLGLCCLLTAKQSRLWYQWTRSS